jgi:integrase
VAKILTDAAARRLVPGKKRRFIRDGATPSLYLVISPSGARSWMMRFRRPGGRPGKLVLGAHDMSGREPVGRPEIGMPLSLASARQLAAEAHRLRALGQDVVADHKARKHRHRVEIESRAANSFGACARAYINECAKPRIRRWHEIARLIGLQPADLESIPGGLVQRWGDKPIKSIDTSEIWGAIDEARRVGVPGIAPRSPGLSNARQRALHSALSAMFTWLQQHRRIEVNPIAGLHRPTPPEARDRVLSPDEIRWFWTACGKIGTPFGTIFQLLLLTGQRLSEVGGMRRDELVGDQWHIPGSRTKNRRPHTVPLVPMVQKLIASAGDRHNIIFSTTGHTPPSGWSNVKERLDGIMLSIASKTIPAWRLHDLRRTFVTGCGELGIRPDVIELVVNHISGSRGGIAGVYNKAALLDERRAALERWATHIERLVSGRPTKKVVPLR